MLGKRKREKKKESESTKHLKWSTDLVQMMAKIYKKDRLIFTSVALHSGVVEERGRKKCEVP